MKQSAGRPSFSLLGNPLDVLLPIDHLCDQETGKFPPSLNLQTQSRLIGELLFQGQER